MAPSLDRVLRITRLVPEEALVLACARVEMSEEALEQARDALACDPDWDEVIGLSIRHAVAPLVHASFERVAAEPSLAGAIPPHILERLRSLRHGNEARNRRLYGVIAEIAAAFAECEIDLLGLKEVSLAKDVYPPGLRPFGDVDVLIHQSDYERAAAVFRDHGFYPRTDTDLRFTLKYAWAHHFHRADGDVWLDVQWNVLQREWDVYGEGNVDFEIERMWRRSEHLELDGAEIRVPCREDMLFHLVLHAEGHGYAELSLLCDIADLARRYRDELDWDDLTALGARYGVEDSISNALSHAVSLLGAEVPQTVFDRLRPRYFRGVLVEAVFGNLTNLHSSLDEIRTDAAAPEAAVDRWERIVRRQARAAMELYGECDGLLEALRSHGVAAAAVTGVRPERIFPSEELASFGEVQVLLPRSDDEALRRSLADREFVDIKSRADSGAYVKRILLESNDPVLVEERNELAVEVTVDRDAAGFMAELMREEVSRRAVARRSAWKPTGPAHPGPTLTRAGIRISTVSPEEALVCAGMAVAALERDRLFHLTPFLDLVRRSADDAESSRLLLVARSYGAEEAVRDVLLMAQAVGAAGNRVTRLLERFVPPKTAPPMFRWARHGEEALHRYRPLKNAFFVLFTMRSIEGTRARARYLTRAIALRRLRVGAVITCVGRLALSKILPRNEVSEQREIVYWIEPTATPGEDS